jgi:hypothetical protein
LQPGSTQQQSLFSHALAGGRQMFFGIGWGTHLFGQEGSKTSTINVINHYVLSPIGNMMFGLTGHTTGHVRHKPRIAVFRFILRGNFIVRREPVIGLDGMLDIVAGWQRLDAQNVIEVKTFVTGNLGCHDQQQQERKTQ